MMGADDKDKGADPLAVLGKDGEETLKNKRMLNRFLAKAAFVIVFAVFYALIMHFVEHS
jgi:hypothetical protein